MIIDCPHARNVTPHSMQCGLIVGTFAGYANPNYPCRQCRTEWPAPDRPPTPQALTPTIVSLVESMAEAITMRDQLAYDRAMSDAGLPTGCGGCG